jgi:hypothetical protein
MTLTMGRSGYSVVSPLSSPSLLLLRRSLDILSMTATWKIDITGIAFLAYDYRNFSFFTSQPVIPSGRIGT